MTTEAKIILPEFDNDGASLHREAREIEDMLLDAFGGWNKAKSEGAWKDPKTGKVYRDDCQTYTVAAEWSQDRISLLRQAPLERSLIRGKRPRIIVQRSPNPSRESGREIGILIWTNFSVSYRLDFLLHLTSFVQQGPVVFA